MFETEGVPDMICAGMSSTVDPDFTGIVAGLVNFRVLIRVLGDIVCSVFQVSYNDRIW